jgi:tetratricopeptide (TPR) repeat protein
LTFDLSTCCRLLACLSLLLLTPAGADSQVTAECRASECADGSRADAAPSRRLWLEAASIHQLKLEFVEALQEFTRAQAGTFGDEGAALVRSVASMGESLQRWDRAIEQFQTEARRLVPAAETELAVATVLLDRYRIEDALRALKAAENQDDSRADIYTLQALAHGAADRPHEAARALRRVSALSPDNPAVLYTFAQHLAQSGRPEDAARVRRDFQRALRKRDDASNGSQPGSTPFERIDLLRQAAGVAPIFPQARYAEGYAALRAGDYAAAVSRFSASSAADPLVARDVAARERVVRAASMIRQGRLATALEELQRVAADMPDQSEAHRLLGLTYWLGDQQGRSIEHLRTAIRLAPDDERSRIALADVLAEGRRFAEAERELMQAVDSGTPSGLSRYRLAQLYERQSLLARAASSFHESEAFGPIIGRDQFYRGLGSLLVNQSDFDGAVAAYTRRIEVNPNNGEAHRQLGEIYFLQGRDDEALAEFATAAWLDPRDARAYAAAGQVHVRMLKYADATVALERALSLDPGLREARYALGTSLMRLGRTEDARRELEVFQQQQSEAEAVGQQAFELDALRREGSKSLVVGAYDPAMASFEAALKIEPSARSHRDLGLALFRARRLQEAIERLKAAQQLEETAEGFSSLADAYAAAGDLDESGRQRSLSQQTALRARLDRISERAR